MYNKKWILRIFNVLVNDLDKKYLQSLNNHFMIFSNNDLFHSVGCERLQMINSLRTAH